MRKKKWVWVWIMGAEIISLGFCLLERIREDTLEIDDPPTQFGFLPPASIKLLPPSIPNEESFLS